MRPQEIIAKKRDGKALSDADIGIFIDGVCSGTWADYQITALLMAMFVNDITLREQRTITRAMLNSGEVFDLSDIDKPKADKHSTGGVGDKTSLIIAPVLAACGLAVPMISGRGLGHTGGTLDKLESIPGYKVGLSYKQMKSVIRECGFALVGQTKKIVPADRKIYALRDATATVPYIPLIVASIMSKKLAEDLDHLVLDVKTGHGAFIQRFSESKKLAAALCETGRSFGVTTKALVTDMSEPLGRFSGNAVEVYECIKILRGEADEMMADTVELSIALSAELLVQAKIAKDEVSAREMIFRVIDSGQALELFKKNIELQGGDPKVCDRPDSLLTKKLYGLEIKADGDGYISDINSLTFGEAVCEIGGGRMKAEDGVDHAVGFESLAKIGDRVKNGQTLAVLNARNRTQAESVSQKLHFAIKISPEPTVRHKLIRAKV